MPLDLQQNRGRSTRRISTFADVLGVIRKEIFCQPHGRFHVAIRSFISLMITPLDCPLRRNAGHLTLSML